MKTALLLIFGLGTFSHALEVHEWGTFTVLSGSDGFQVPWYAPAGELAQLPDFVSKPMTGKAGDAKIRMETPVIYFYPEKEMEVSVEVAFTEGTVSETFPHSTGGMVATSAPGMFAVNGKWTGTLLPPTDKAALSEIPTIPDSENPEPYAAAREVPEAWIFKSDLKEIPGLEVQPHFPQVEKFIFYRGAGDGYIPISTTMEDDEVTVTNHGGEAIPFAVALRVRGGKAAWSPLPEIPGQSVEYEVPENLARTTFPKAARPLDDVESELATVWKKALAADGLTPAEASAMVETWRMTWFRENGDRILTLVPREVTDAMLPLKVTPAPEKTERVFVARIEMVSPGREEALVGLLNSSEIPGGDEVAEFQELDLGRFGNGALEVATRLQKNRMAQKFHALKLKGQKLRTSAR